MDGQITIAFLDKCHLWIVGEKARSHNTDVLKKPYIFSQVQKPTGETHIQISGLPGGSPPEVEIQSSAMVYPVTDQGLIDLYIEATTGIKVQHAPLAMPSGSGTMGPRRVQ